MDADRFLILRMKHGDTQALDSFVRKYYAVISRYCYAHTQHRSDAEDLTQETFVRFFRSLRTYQHHGKALNYLYVIASHVCADDARNRVCTEELREAEALCADAPNTDTQIAVRQAVAALPEDLREAAILYYLQDLPQREIAQILSIGLPLVKYRLRRAKELLKEVKPVWN